MLSAGSSLGGSGSWIDKADSLDISSALVLWVDRSELELTLCLSAGGTNLLGGCASIKACLDKSIVGDGRGDGNCVASGPVELFAETAVAPSMPALPFRSNIPSSRLPLVEVLNASAMLEDVGPVRSESSSEKMP